MAYPTAYTPELAERILQRLEDGEHLATICRDADMPSKRTVLRWRRDKEDFAQEYQLAREAAAHEFDLKAKELVDSIKDRDGAIAARAKFDILRWRAGVHAPRVFGDRLDVNVDANFDLAAMLDRGRQRVIEGRLADPPLLPPSEDSDDEARQG